MTKKFVFPIWSFAALFLFFIVAAPRAFAGEVTLQDNSLLVAFDSDSGALTRLENKTTHWVVERRPALGISFRMFAPLPNRRWNPIYGPKQHAVEVKKISDNEVQLQWKNLVSENGGTLPITFTADVTLNNGALTFNSTLDNDSPLTVETIEYPYFGDLSRPSPDASLQACTMRQRNVADVQDEELYPHFVNRKGYWGVFYPTKTMEAWDSLFCLIQAPNQGLYVEMDNPKPKYRLEYYFEQHPGLISAVTQLVPPEDEIPGKDSLWGKDTNAENAETPVHLEFRTCHFVFAHGHTTMQLAPIVVRCYQGGQDAGENLYKQWRSNQQ